jgi:Xaa-Pro aminopeptidase
VRGPAAASARRGEVQPLTPDRNGGPAGRTAGEERAGGVGGGMVDRWARLRQGMARRGLDGIVLAAPEYLSNVPVRYLTGFAGSSSYLVAGMADACLLTDFRYVEAASALARGYRVVRHAREAAVTLAEVISEMGLKMVGFDDERVPVRMYEDWRARLPGVSWRGLGGLMDELRLVKDAHEIAAIRRAADLSGRAFEELLPDMPGMTERQVAVALEHRMREVGLDGPGFSTIVASGPRGSLPHAQPTDRVLAAGDLVTVDFGGLADGYRSDETVTFGIGEVPARLRGLFDLVAEAQAAGIAAVRPGVRASAVDRASRAVIEAAGYGEAFGHNTGHGVGLDVHERPLAAREPVPERDDVLAPGMTLTVEPGIYLPGEGGVRLEDTLLVTETGSEPLTRVAKAWRSL